MPQKRDGRRTIQIKVGGMHSAGDAALVPDGYTRRQRNVRPSPGPVWPARPPHVSDLAVDISSFLKWEDLTNGVERLVGIGRFTPSSTINLKAATSETWTSSANSLTALVAAQTNLRGKTYATTRDVGANNTAAIPFVYNGTTLSQLFTNEGFRPATCTTFIDRIFWSGGLEIVTNRMSGGNTAPYDPATWTVVNASTQLVTSGGAIIARMTAVNATGDMATLPASDLLTSATSEGTFVYRGEARSTSATYNMPLTAQVVINYPWATGTAYGVNDIVRKITANGFRYRVTQAGTSHATTEPVWPTTIGNTIVDNTVTWICDGPDVIGSRDILLPNVSQQGTFTAYEVEGTLPVPHGNTKVSARIKFGNTATPSVTVDVPIEVSYRDGLADGTVGKANHGHQVTVTAARHPFLNVESAAVATIATPNTIRWSEPGEPSRILAQNFYLLRDRASQITASAAIDNRLAIFQRDGIVTFVPNESDPDNPIIRERTYDGIGCLHPKALDIFNGTAFVLDAVSFWAWSPGSGPRDLCGDGMRSEVMDRSSASWVPSQGSFTYRPIVAIDRTRQTAYLYIQKSKIYGYRLQTDEWFYDDVNDAGFEVQDMTWLPTTQNLYVAWGAAQVSRLDHSVSNQADAVNASGTTYTVVSQTDIPIEFRGPQLDVILDRVNAYVKATADQTGQVFYVYVSRDQGATFTLYNEITLPTGSKFERVPIDIYQLDPSFVIRLEKRGNGGAANYTLSSAEAEINIMAGSFNRISPTQVGSNLT